ncbi:uncharacterized zinc finger protein CG12744 isoform X3 [Drosophila virilis]|uniref:uncharacterized zinc finger protein CG12744 isoform X2 n=1 Tax=Drosophila virilis TaxID=7244 RepID=UPI0013964BBD|nr:uncharacterized zinc finger protein CG12744 isoform X2 [Drosophila virilis]XP_032292070.1 uncharacterized zinc finger protein CG12744 isoform X3 [Drosophila virilis]
MYLRDMLNQLSSLSTDQIPIEARNQLMYKRAAAQMEESEYDDCPNVELEEGGINCFLCQQLFTDIDELQQHFLTHFAECPANTTTKFFECDVCGRSLRSEQELHKHQERFHAAHLIKKDIETRNRFQCEKCNNVYLSLDFLERHIQLAHNVGQTFGQAPPAQPQQMTVVFLNPPAKQKYPPRSPFFNPNLWLDCDAYVSTSQ